MKYIEFKGDQEIALLKDYVLRLEMEHYRKFARFDFLKSQDRPVDALVEAITEIERELAFYQDLLQNAERNLPF